MRVGMNKWMKGGGISSSVKIETCVVVVVVVVV